MIKQTQIEVIGQHSINLLTLMERAENWMNDLINNGHKIISVNYINIEKNLRAIVTYETR